MAPELSRREGGGDSLGGGGSRGGTLAGAHNSVGRLGAAIVGTQPPLGHSLLILFEYIFPLASGDFFHTYVLINSQSNTIGIFSKDL